MMNIMNNTMGKEFFEVSEINGEVHISRYGYFDKVSGENKPYAWYQPARNHIPVQRGTDMFQEVFGNEELDDVNITLMTADEVKDRLSTIGEAKPLPILEVTRFTKVGVYYDEF